jgi:hypothetical protein
VFPTKEICSYVMGIMQKIIAGMVQQEIEVVGKREI